MRIICCRFGTKFTDWHVNNLKHMIDNYSGLTYDSFEVIENDIYGNWYNKLQMYDKFRDGENLYFDLDVIIYDKLPNLIRKEFTLLDEEIQKEEETVIFTNEVDDYNYAQVTDDTASNKNIEALKNDLVDGEFDWDDI